MSTAELLEAFEGLTLTDRFAFLEAALRSLRETATAPHALEVRDTAREDLRQRMAEAAVLLLADYRDDSELTAFTALDSEPFCAEG